MQVCERVSARRYKASLCSFAYGGAIRKATECSTNIIIIILPLGLSDVKDQGLKIQKYKVQKLKELHVEVQLAVGIIKGFLCQN